MENPFKDKDIQYVEGFVAGMKAGSQSSIQDVVLLARFARDRISEVLEDMRKEFLNDYR